MGIPVVIKASGGLPVTIATNGRGTPMEVATNGYGIAVTQATNGLPVVGITFGPTLQLTGNSVAENATVNTTVGTLSVTSGTTGTPTYTLTDSAGGKFNISGSALRTNAALDYETATSHNVTVSVSGLTPAVSSATFTVSVTDVVEGSYAGPGDLATGWIAWYGLRAFTAATAGTPAIRLIRDSGGELDINTLANGTLDIATATSFVSGTTGRIKTWYDQTGNGYNSEIASGVQSFTLNASGSRPGITVAGGQAYGIQGFPSAYSQPWSMSVVAKRTSGGQSSILSCGNSQVLFATAANTVGAYAGGGDVPTVSGAADGSFHDFSVVANGASTIICLRGIDTTGLVIATDSLGLGAVPTFPSNTSGGLTGIVLEGGIRAGGFTAPERAAIAANQATYYGHR